MIVKNNNVKQTNNARDSFAKFLYSKLFDWLIWRINEVLSRHHGMSVEMEFEPVILTIILLIATLYKN